MSLAGLFQNKIVKKAKNQLFHACHNYITSASTSAKNSRRHTHWWLIYITAYSDCYNILCSNVICTIYLAGSWFMWKCTTNNL